MTRAETIKKMVEMASTITGTNSDKYDYNVENAIWDMCMDWNREHYDGRGEDAEIFMAEDEDEDGNYRFYIEDDYFTYYE